MFFEFLASIVGVVVALIAVLIAYIKWQQQYWQRKNFKCIEAEFPFGSLGNPLNRKESFGLTLKNLYNIVRKNKWKHAGFYTLATHSYLPADLDYVKNVLTKDFQYFTDRGVYYNEKDDPLSAHMFSLGGAKWRNLRMKLTPTFTSGKMKMMFQTLLECEKNLHEVMEKFNKNHDAIDIKEVLGCFTTDIIGSCAFGLDCNTFKEEDSPFRRYGKKIFIATKPRMLLAAIAMNFPNFAKSVGIKITLPDVSDFFMKVAKDTVEYREKNGVTRNDFMQLLINLKNQDKSLSMEELAAQAFIFFIAGFETSSTLSTFLLYEIARHQDVQDRLRKEIVDVLAKHQGKTSYEAIQDMKYMNQVIDEALRMYPPLPLVTRKVVKDYKIPDEDMILEKGTRVFVPIMGIHYDPEYYPNPEKFDPDRFSDDAKKTRHSHAHLPFGEGPRNCIGLRFGVMQTKVGLTSLLKKYRFTVNKKTQEPLQMKINSFILAAEGEIWLNAEQI